MEGPFAETLNWKQAMFISRVPTFNTIQNNVRMRFEGCGIVHQMAVNCAKTNFHY
jgi:hypothetical protein